MARQRAFADVPGLLLAVSLLAMATQLTVGVNRNANLSRAVSALPPTPTLPVARVVAIGEPVWLSRAISMWLQLFDYQSGTSLSWRALDYNRLTQWLDLQLRLDPHNPFPLLAALHLYGAVTDKEKVRTMVDYVVVAFRRNPAMYWRWMADAAVIAKHRLGDVHLAERIASELDTRTAGIPIPSWVRQMHIFLKADIGEREIAAAMIAALIESGEVDSEEEANFLRQRLRALSEDVDKSSEK